MSYASSYCDDALDAHVNIPCDYEGEKGRIRRGAWVHKSYIDTLMEDPTDESKWTQGIADSKIILLPKLSGTFDGGTPKMVAGFGDEKEKYAGSDFKANLKDPVYAENWAHYKSLVGNSSWHLAYVTESKVHISGKPVTVAPKNPITENIDDDIIWESECSWFEYFTPAPHDMPPSVFSSPE